MSLKRLDEIEIAGVILERDDAGRREAKIKYFVLKSREVIENNFSAEIKSAGEVRLNAAYSHDKMQTLGHVHYLDGVMRR
jgi:hypothetical protein